MSTSGPTDLLEWGLPRLRDLPWRRTRDPWAILVSEVMLQQTQALRVVPKWSAFLHAYPTPTACAAAPLGDVLRLWQGLGYPRRAKNLHAAAQQIAQSGEFPTTLDALLDLPGVGPYTARAVLVFAFDRDVGVVDTNIARVLARLCGSRLTARQAQTVADAAVPRGESWAWNQCLMDLGAALCRPLAPGCRECPLATRCAWHGQGEDPAPGSAGVSRAQARFDGSDRQARGRLMKALVAGEVSREQAPKVMDCSVERADRLIEALAADGLVLIDDSTVCLP
jgi:A/G-specific adenine glycosylase